MFFIKPPQAVHPTLVHLMHQSENLLFVKLRPVSDGSSALSQQEGTLKCPVFADFQIIKENSDDNVPITFLYALETSGEFMDSQAEKQNRWQFWKWILCNQSVSFEIKEYYASKNSHVSEAKWVSNEKHNLMIQKSQADLHNRMVDLSLLRLIKKNLTPEQVQAHYAKRGFQLVNQVTGDKSTLLANSNCSDVIKTNCSDVIKLPVFQVRLLLLSYLAK